MSLFNSLIPTLGRQAVKSENGNSEGIGPSVKPVYDIKETKEAFGLTVYLPGVAKDGVEITAENDQLRIVGRQAWKQPEGWTALYRESPSVPFELVLDHDNAIQLEKIHAELVDGVLRLSLPKAEAIKPRKIAIA
jgi:HSP20 family molecular chaperone IbpA